MNILESITFGEFHWAEIIYAMVGSFVGIFVPLWIDKRRVKKQEKDARKKILVSLNRELDSVKTLIENNQASNEYEIFSFTTFVWDSIISSGMLPDMLADKKIEGTKLMEIYAELSILKELHNAFDHINPQGSDSAIEDLRELYADIMKKRSTVYKMIVIYQEIADPKANKRRK